MTDLTIKLNTGRAIPTLGLGTWQSAEGEVRKAVAHAISSGYRHIDAAYAYGNESEVGEGIQDGLQAAGLSRGDIFVTTKLWCTYHTRVQQALEKSLKSLKLDYVDLYLMHWPVAMNPHGNHDKFPTLPDGSRDLSLERSHLATYRDMEKLVETGKVKAIGVCNYSRSYLEQLLPSAKVIPAVNQIENHPMLPQQDIVDMCTRAGIVTMAYSPLGSAGSPLMSDERVCQLAAKKETTASSILLSYHVSRGNAVLAKSVTPARIEENTKIVPLSPADLATLAEISKDGVHRFVYPAFGVDFGFPDKSCT